jgi:hypothetical protein
MVTTAEKVAWFKAYARTHPTSTVPAARLAIVERFGENLSTTTVSAILKATRDELGIPQPAAVRKPAAAKRPKTVKSGDLIALEELMRRVNLRGVRLLDRGMALEFET